MPGLYISPSLMARREHDICTVRRYGDRYKLVYHPYGIAAGRPSAPLIATVGDGDDVAPAKLDNSISRARSAVYELAACNDWDYFVTLTLDAAKYDRMQLPAWRHDLSQWIRNQRRLHGCSMRYLLVPEMHRDGAWHMHGLVSGLRDDAFEFNANGYLDYIPYRDKFGFISLSRIRDKDKVSTYIAKYVDKNLAQRREEFGAHLYYCSQGLARAELVARGHLHMDVEAIKWDYVGDYVRVLWLDTPPDMDAAPDMSPEAEAWRDWYYGG